MSKSTSPAAIQKIVGGLENLFSTHGALTMAARKFQNGDNSFLFYGCRYYRNLITDLPNQYCGHKPKFASIMDELEKYPEDFPHTRSLLKQISDTLFGFESFARFKDIDIHAMLNAYHAHSLDTEYNSEHQIQSLRLQFLDLIEKLKQTSALEFGVIYMPDKLHITVNMNATERNSWTSDGPTTDLRKKTPNFEGNFKHKDLRRTG